MKMLVFALAAVTVLTLSPATAFAKREGKVDSILFTCNMAFRATGKSIYIGLGWSNIKGKGTISCYDLVHGTTEILPIKVRVKGPGAGLGVTGLVISGAAAGIGVERGPQDLIGRYVAVRGNASVGVGVGGAIGLRVSKGGISIPLSIQGQSGLGAGIDLLSLKIESDGDSHVEAAPPVVGRPAPQSAPPVATNTSASASAEASADAEAEDSDGDVEAEAEASAATSVKANNTTTATEASANSNAAASTQSGSTQAASSAAASAAASAKSNVVYVQEGQPLQILDAKGRVIQTIYLKQK